MVVLTLSPYVTLKCYIPISFTDILGFLINFDCMYPLLFQLILRLFCTFIVIHITVICSTIEVKSRADFLCLLKR